MPTLPVVVSVTNRAFDVASFKTVAMFDESSSRLVNRTISLPPIWIIIRSNCCGRMDSSREMSSCVLAPFTPRFVISVSGNVIATSPAIDSSGTRAPVPTAVLSPIISILIRASDCPLMNGFVFSASSRPTLISRPVRRTSMAIKMRSMSRSVIANIFI